MSIIKCPHCSHTWDMKVKVDSYLSNNSQFFHVCNECDREYAIEIKYAIEVYISKIEWNKILNE